MYFHTGSADADRPLLLFAATHWQLQYSYNAVMNVASNALLDPLATAHEEAVERVNAWRGRCLASYARVEMAVSETLIALAAARDGIALPHMFGQRLTALKEAIGTDDDAAPLLEALSAFAVHMPLRAFLAHGDARVTICNRRQWQVVLTVLALKQGSVESSFLMIDELEAQATARRLGRDRQRLVTRLAQWRELRALSPRSMVLRAGTAGVRLHPEHLHTRVDYAG